MIRPAAEPPASQLYFRGPVLSHFDGRNWQPTLRWMP
ncbi:DUF3488 domain-containing protein [Staphylococcus epidermidis]|nr:DUF3488 domain-containing protein [Staphylococcus epidermidis]